jgi:hypothetical protein
MMKKHKAPVTVGNSKRASKLNEREWNFYKLDPGEVHLAFFYEYARSSKPVREKFQQLKTAQQPLKYAWVNPKCLSQQLQEYHLLPILY